MNIIADIVDQADASARAMLTASHQRAVKRLKKEHIMQVMKQL
jgi:hypothetical protein